MFFWTETKVSLGAGKGWGRQGPFFAKSICPRVDQTEEMEVKVVKFSYVRMRMFLTCGLIISKKYGRQKMGNLGAEAIKMEGEEHLVF